MALLSRVPWSRVEAFLIDRDDRRAIARVVIGTFALFLGLAAILAAVGVVHHNLYGHDSFVLLEGGWRVYQGQRPHVDFYTPLGPVPLLLVALGMKVGGPTADALTHANVFATLVLVPWALAIGQGRFSAPLLAVFAGLVGFTVLGTHSLGYGVTETSSAMTYNRIGFALLALVAVETLLPRRVSAGGRAELAGGVSTGAVAALAAFLKVSFAGAAGLMILVRLVCARRSRGTWASGVVLGGLAVTGAFLAYLQFDVTAVFHDLLMGVTSRRQSLRWREVVGILDLNGWWFVLLPLLTTLVASESARVQLALPTMRALVAGSAVVLLTGLGLIATNWQPSEVPTFGILALILLEVAGRARRAPGAQQASAPAATQRYVAVAMLATLLAGRFVVHDAAGVFWTAAYQLSGHPDPAPQRLGGKSVYYMLVSNSGGTCPFNYGERVNDGLVLVRRHLRPQDRIVTLDFTDPFTFTLEQPSPRGDALWWHWLYTFSGDAHLPPERVFGDATIVMIPRICPEGPDTFFFLRRLYGSYLERHYRILEEDRFWLLAVRRGDDRMPAPRSTPPGAPGGSPSR